MAADPQFRVQDDRFESGANAPEAPKKKSALATCLTGCLIAFVVMLVLGALAAWWIWNNAASWAAGAGSQVAKEMINQTELPEEEKTDISLQIDRLADAGKAGELTLPQLSKFFQDFAQSPLMTTLAMSVIDKKYITPSGLSDEEKAEAQVTVQRFMRGAIDQKFNEAAMEKAMAPVSEEREGQVVLREKVTDEELRAFLKNAKSEADAAGIPAEVESVDPSDEFKRLVDQTLGEAAAMPAADDEAPANGGAPADSDAPTN
jgi:hypothetical protein